jgi:hypothetical protein
MSIAKVVRAMRSRAPFGDDGGVDGGLADIINLHMEF